MRYNAPGKELQSLFNKEWKRAKKLGKPLFDNKLKPRFYTLPTLWMLSDTNPIGIHYGGSGYMRKANGAWASSDVIIVKDSLDSKKMLSTIRHEICHVVYRNHKSQFQNLLRGLERE